MPFTRTNDIVTHFSAEGPAGAPMIVFINSLGTDFRIWDAVAPTFSQNHVVRYDKRGHGLSDLGSTPCSIDQYVDDLLALFSGLNVVRASVVGLSIGGMIAQRFAALAPEKVATLVLCDTAAKIGTPEMWAARIAAVEQNGIEAIADAVLERWFAKDFREQRKTELAGWRNMLVRTPVEGYVGACAAIRDADLTAGAAMIKAPTLCVVGDEDGATPPDLVGATASRIERARFSVIENAGHLPCIDQPAVLVELIKSHLQEHGIV